MSSREFAEWLAYYQVEPFGEERADARMASLAALQANLQRDPKKRKEPYQPSDFMPRYGAAPVEETPAWQRMFDKMRTSVPNMRIKK